MDSDLESKLISLINQLIFFELTTDSAWYSITNQRAVLLITPVISLVRSMDLDSQPKPESEFMSLVNQAISVFYTTELDSLPQPLSALISLIAEEFFTVSDSKPELDSDSENQLLVRDTLLLRPVPELLSLFYQIFYLAISMDLKLKKLITFCPEVRVTWNKEDFPYSEKRGRFYVIEEDPLKIKVDLEWDCLPLNWTTFKSKGEDITHFLCEFCDGRNHEEYEKAPLEVKHSLHPKHSLQLVLLNEYEKIRQCYCYCCDKKLLWIFYYCSTCDFAMSIACVQKPPVLAIDNPKRHGHTLVLFHRTVSLTCDVCALADSSVAIYMCPPCGFAVHSRCINLPQVIRISRHLHRISFVPSFDQGNWFCGVCRTKIDNDYGGYSCIKDNCSYIAHSRCATQINIWDGEELQGVPEETEEELEPFGRISDGVIQHFSHQQHHLRLDENTSRDYDENKQCQACITPIYFGNFYSCMQCDFIIHEACADLSRKIYHPIHPHMLTLVGGYDRVIDYNRDFCSACDLMCLVGFFYECSKEDCNFRLHPQCATISEPLTHESHMHPLFLTSKPGETKRTCWFCKSVRKETFNCIEGGCDFALCFTCATVPQKVRYKHDKHTLNLSYGEETSTGI